MCVCARARACGGGVFFFFFFSFLFFSMADSVSIYGRKKGCCGGLLDTTVTSGKG